MMKFVRILGLVAGAALLFSCSKDDNYAMQGSREAVRTPSGSLQARTTAQRHRKVMILYSAAFHNLSYDLKKNVAELEEGYLPLNLRNDDALLVFARNTDGGYDRPVSPVLIHMYRDSEGRAVRDTVLRYPPGTLAADPETLRSVLTYIKDQYPARSYGMVFSSHATGWLPEGYYDAAGSDYMDVWNVSAPRRSIGMDITGKQLTRTEMEVDEMAAAIPMHLDYLLFDACLMACVEVAYAFRDKVDMIGFSPSEVLQYGFDYTKMGAYLLEGLEPDPKAVCRSYFERYDTQSGASRSASISMVDLREMDALSAVCKTLFEKYRAEIAAIRHTSTRISLNGYSVQVHSPQNYFTGQHPWFFDLRDILAVAGASDEDLALLDAVLSRAVVYEAHTPSFLIGSQFAFHSCCGMSMFLPSASSDSRLSAFYSTLAWNQATGLI